MKRAGDDDILLSPKRIRKAISITDSNIDEVRKQYHTDCEIIALNGEPAPKPAVPAPKPAKGKGRRSSNAEEIVAEDNPKFRVFPVNRLVLSGWSEPFSVFVEGQFAESLSGKIYLPYSTDVVAVLVQHMYFTCNHVDAPVITPEVAFPIMEIAHMYERMDLFALAEPSFWKLDGDKFSCAHGNDLVLRALRLGVDAEKLYSAYRRSSHFTFSLFDSTNATMKPFLALFGQRNLIYHDPIIWSEYTEELATGAMYSVWTPEGWKADVELFDKWTSEKAEKLDTLRRFNADVAMAREVTKCGVISWKSMQAVLREIIAQPGMSQANATEATRLLSRPNDWHAGYCALMRKVYPLPPKPAPAPVQ